MTPLNQDTLKLIDRIVHLNCMDKEQERIYRMGIIEALTNPTIIKSAGLYTLQEMQTQMLNLLEKEEDKWVKESSEQVINKQREFALCLYAYISGYSSLGKPKIPTADDINEFLDRELPLPTPTNQNI